ncbi:pleckstrin homology domain-containing family A member 7 [Rhinatrema bivittatum]|uniref:pleckstrin homology domain-containing family A member 7 n=1 Tax=Rhinatrema bivittatum TaxID=194408 RepID=UPI00112ED81C|nr:pleckstrin homology domain-containing family A member 7 [Rhinatrema bivittatum]
MAAPALGRDTLPAPWSYGVCRDGRVFFVNDQARSTTWLHPRTGEPVNSGHMIRSDLPRGWEEGFTEEGASYFIDHNQKATTFRHPVTGQISPENLEFDIREEHNFPMSQQQADQRPSSLVSESSTAVTTSTTDAKYAAKPQKPSNKVHSFGKRDHSIKRNPNVPVVVRGWLHKQDSSGMRLWKRRWFVLADYCLFYYKDSREEAVLGSIPLPSYVISPVGLEDRISRKYSFKAVHTGMRAFFLNKSCVIGSPSEHSGVRTYYFSADTQEDMNDWIRAMNQAALLKTHLALKRETEVMDWQDAPQANHIDSYKGYSEAEAIQRKEFFPRANEILSFETREEMRKAREDEERYTSKNDTLEPKQRKPKHSEVDLVYRELAPRTSRSQTAQPQPAEKNGILPNSLTAGANPVEYNGTGVHKRGVVPRTANPEKQAQRKSNVTQVEHWVKVQKGDPKSLASDPSLIRHAPNQALSSHPENYQTLPKNTRQPLGSSPPPNSNLPSDYKYAQDRISHFKMSNEDRKASKEGTVWQLYEWQQRQQFKHGSPTGPLYTSSTDFIDRGKGRSSLDVPRSISVPPSPSDILPPAPPKVYPPRRPHTPAERVTVKPSEDRPNADTNYAGSPRKMRTHALKSATHIDRRSMPAVGYMTHTVSAPSLHGKSPEELTLLLIRLRRHQAKLASVRNYTIGQLQQHEPTNPTYQADDTYIQLKKDLEYLDLKVIISLAFFLWLPQKPSNKVHSFGKRDHSIKRNPNVPVVVRGWLHKQDSSGMRLWKRRWFVLADYCLFYYKDSREEAVLGSIPLPSYVISPVGLEDRISRKYSFKVCVAGSIQAVHTGMRAFFLNKSCVIGSPSEHSGVRTYYFSADTQEDMNDWIRAMNQAALLKTHLALKRETEVMDWQDAPQANHIDSYKGYSEAEAIQRKEFFPRANEILSFETREEMRKAREDEERYTSKNDTLEPKQRKPKHSEVDLVYRELAPRTSRSQTAQPQPAEKNGILPNSLTAGANPVEYNGTGVHKRGVVPRTANPEKQAQRKSNVTQVEHWVKVQKGDPKSLASDPSLIRHAPNQALSSHPENYQTLPKNTRQPLGSSPPPNSNLPSDYKYAQDRISHFKMSNEDRKASKEGTVWQLYEWQQRQQFKHGSPTGPLYTSSTDFIDRGKGRSSLDVPRSISVPPSPSDILPPAPPKVYPPRRPHTPAERVTVKPSEDRPNADTNYAGSPRKMRTHALKSATHIDRRSMPAVGYMTHTVSAPSLHGKSADDTYIQLKKDLEYLDLKVTGQEGLKGRTAKPVRIAESDVDVKLSILCEQDRILHGLEEKIRALKDNKDKLESVLEVLHRQMEQYSNQPQHVENISCQQRLLQEDLVQIRAEISKVSTEMENAWNEYRKLENDVNQLKQALQEEMSRSYLSQEKTQLQKDLWRIEDVTAGLSANKANYKVIIESMKNPERKRVPLFPHPSVPSATTSLTQQSPPLSPVKSALEVRLLPQLQPYSQPRPQAQSQQQRNAEPPLHSPTKLLPKEDEAPPRPPLPQMYSPDDQPPAVPPLPKEATVIRHTSVRGLKRQSDERKRDRELGQYVNGDYRVELRSYMSEPELANLAGDLSQTAGFVDPDSGYQTLPGKGLSGSTSRLHQSSAVTSYVTLRRGPAAESSKDTPKSALERLYSGDHQRSKMSAEEQLERMKRHQKALVRERKRTLSQGDRQSAPSRTFIRPISADVGSWKREQDFDLQLLEKAARDAEDKEKDDEAWLKVKAVPVTELDLEPLDYDLDINKELSKPDKVSIPERYIELDPEEPLSSEELEARYRKVEKIKNILARSSMHGMPPTVSPDEHSPMDVDSQLQEQERMITISYALASEASQRSKQVAAQQLAYPSNAPSPHVPQTPHSPLSNGFRYTFV